MEILNKLLSFSLLLAIMASPILVLFGLKKFHLKSNLIIYLILGITITSILTLLFAWWSDASKHMLLSHYGYDFEAMDDGERFANVSAQNLERVKRLKRSMMGIGWPLKAFMTYVVYAPYLLIVYLITYLINKYKRIYT